MDRPLAVVFGGTGFLGRRVVEALARADWRVRVAARRPEAQSFAALPPDRIQRTSVDLRDETRVREALQGAEAVVNAVSLYVEKPGLSFQAIHVDGAARLARCAQEVGLRQLVHVSGLGVDVESPSAFIRARARGEAAVQTAFPAATSVRPSVMVGCDDAFLSSLNLVTRLRLVPLFGTGGTRLQPVFVEDVAAVIARLLADHPNPGPTLELGGAETYTYRQAVQVVADYFDRRVLSVPVPFAIWHLLVKLLRVLPNPPLTTDQLILMQKDNTASPAVPGFGDMGMRPRTLEEVLPLCF